ncbi:hypothetical protein IPM65_02735 [Candidatus Roizmanbacteria bacterium]|nr:MAG: hypothetical protein IPM65_02735 [Candidatus Roizmanbacteria bacterium]
MDDIGDQSQTPPPEQSAKPQETGPTPEQKRIVRTVLIVFSVLFFIVITVLGVLAYIQSAKGPGEPTPTPTAVDAVSPTPQDTDTNGWQTFTSTDFGISIQYPPNWKKTDGQSFENGDLFGVMIMGETQREATELYDGATLTIANPITVEKDYETWAKDYYTTHHVDESQPLEFSNETINGIEYLKVYTCGLGCFTYYITEKGDYVYQIVTSADGPSEKEYRQTIDKMLETITFEEAQMTVMPSPPPGALAFSSPDLGIGFFYPQKVQNIQSVDVKETGNKIYVFMTNTEPEDGQWVEVFSKNPDATLEEAITQHFLAGKEDGCYVTVTKTEGSITTAIIDFSYDQSNGLEGMFEKTKYCSEDYAKTNGIRYFWYDSAHPETYLFFSIGQYGIPVTSTENWQDTVRLIRMRE